MSFSESLYDDGPDPELDLEHRAGRSPAQPPELPHDSIVDQNSLTIRRRCELCKQRKVSFLSRHVPPIARKISDV